MRKMQLVLASIFLGGVLLGGIGTGIALVEYSSLSYGGEHRIGEENLVTNHFDFEFEPGEGGITVDNDVYLNGMRIRKIEYDPEVPEGVVRYQVTYNENLVTPVLLFDRNEMEEEQREEEISSGEEEEGAEAGEEVWESEPEESNQKEPLYQGRVWLTASYQGSDLGFLMQNKDQFLEELKNKVISEYEVLYITDIKVKVNPETGPYVKLESDMR